MEKVKFGIIGCGKIAARFAVALGNSVSAELYACAARDSARAEEFGNQHNAEKAYGSYEELLADGQVEAVYIGTVHTTHAQIAQMCINAGKAVICEKPFFTNPQEAEETITLARQKGVLLMEGFWSRTQPAYLKVKEWIKDGKIGDVHLIRAAFCFNMPFNDQLKGHRLWNPELGGGALLDAGVYPYEYVTGIMDGPPEKMVTSVQAAPTGVDATVTMSMSYPGVVADCMTSLRGYMDSDAVISGTEGYIRQHYFVGSRKAELFDRKGGLVECFEDPEEEGFVHEIAHFVDLLRSGKTESPLIPLDDTLDFARQAEKILAELHPSSQPSKFTADELARQEEELRFPSFSADDGMKLGGILQRLLQKDGKSAAIQIELNGFEIFRYMPAGTGRFNDLWMAKKRRTVQIMGKSTLRLWTDMAARGVPRKGGMEPLGDIVFCGGGFPIMLTDGTVIGAIAVSGPGDEYEHELVIRALREQRVWAGT